MDKFFGIRKGECGTESGYVFEMEKLSFDKVFNVGVKGQLGVHFYTQVGDNW